MWENNVHRSTKRYQIQLKHIKYTLEVKIELKSGHKF